MKSIIVRYAVTRIFPATASIPDTTLVLVDDAGRFALPTGRTLGRHDRCAGSAVAADPRHPARLRQRRGQRVGQQPAGHPAEGQPDPLRGDDEIADGGARRSGRDIIGRRAAPPRRLNVGGSDDRIRWTAQHAAGHAHPAVLRRGRAYDKPDALQVKVNGRVQADLAAATLARARAPRRARAAGARASSAATASRSSRRTGRSGRSPTTPASRRRSPTCRSTRPCPPSRSRTSSTTPARWRSSSRRRRRRRRSRRFAAECPALRHVIAFDEPRHAGADLTLAELEAARRGRGRRRAARRAYRAARAARCSRTTWRRSSTRRARPASRRA